MTQIPIPGAPKVFISSTVADLKKYREAARAAAIRAGFLPVMNEDWEARDKPPLKECMERVDGTHLTVALVAHRYGWVPADQSDPQANKSITWLECERTKESDKELLPFTLADKAAWPEEAYEEYRLTEEAKAGRYDELKTLADEVQRNTQGLAAFKSWLTDRRIRAQFAKPADLETEVYAALKTWLADHPDFQHQAKEQARIQADPGFYLRQLYDATGHIHIRGLRVGNDKAHSFPIEELYIELDTGGGGQLRNTLSHPRRVVVGDPGSGKTTFLRWIGHTLVGDRLDPTARQSTERLGLQGECIPVLISIADWLEHCHAAQERNHDCPTTAKDPQWLVHFLAAQSEARGWGLDERWFRERLKKGGLMLLLDGLDEASNRLDRNRATALIQAIAGTWKECPILVTSRPAGFESEALPDFSPSHIEPLNDRAVENFLDRWSRALHRADETAAANHRKELLQALHARPNIRRLARNTVMLTALAVVHWNEKRLPEQRAELYASILHWLARSREMRPGRAGPERSLELLRRLALAMQEAQDGRKTRVPRRWAAERIADQFDGDIDRAEGFLEEEELDSGILVRRGHEVQFWHLTFQEYLAARALGGLSEEEQRQRLLGDPPRFYAPEWREVALLLGGVLYEQGREKVDGLFRAVLDQLYAKADPALADQARAAGLLGGIVRDLSPIGYQPADGRYEQTLEAALGIFDRERSVSVPMETRIEAAEALGQAGDPRMEDERLYWVTIPGGRFLMGAQKSNPTAPNFDPNAYDDETPHEVELSAFQIARWPVTVQQFAHFVEDGGYADPRWWNQSAFGEWKRPDDWTAPGSWTEQTDYPTRPVTNVCWYEARAFCAWFTHRLCETRRLDSGCVIRLPTEAEWESAARGKAARLFPWGNEDPINELLNYQLNVWRPTPVGVYPRGATPEGVLDMAGNVLEWCNDWFDADYYALLKRKNITINPIGPEKGERRLVRGGSWFGDRAGARTVFRVRPIPNHRIDYLGFRLCCASPILER